MYLVFTPRQQVYTNNTYIAITPIIIKIALIVTNWRFIRH